MSWLNDFDCEMITNVKITGLGAITGQDSTGQPTYGTGTVKYNSNAAVWMLNATEILANDKINNPSSHSVVLDPVNVLAELADSDTCVITINGREENFKMNTPDNIMGMGELIQFTAIKKVVS